LIDVYAVFDKPAFVDGLNKLGRAPSAEIGKRLVKPAGVDELAVRLGEADDGVLEAPVTTMRQSLAAYRTFLAQTQARLVRALRPGEQVAADDAAKTLQTALSDLESVDLGKEPQTRYTRRLAAYNRADALLRTADDASAMRELFGPQPAEFPHAYFRRTTAEDAWKRQVAAARSAAMAMPASAGNHDTVAGAARELVLDAIDQADALGRRTLWHIALGEREFIWHPSAADAASAPEAALAVGPDEARPYLNHLRRMPALTEYLHPERLAAHLTAHAATRQAFAADPAVSGDVAVRGRLDDVSRQLAGLCDGYVDQWAKASDALATPNVRDFNALGRLRGVGRFDGRDLAATVSENNKAVSAAFDALTAAPGAPPAAVDRAKAFPRGETDADAALAAGKPVTDLLASWQMLSPESTRAALLNDPARLNAAAEFARNTVRAAPATPGATFYGRLETQSRSALIGALRPLAIERLRAVHQQTKGFYPCASNGPNLLDPAAFDVAEHVGWLMPEGSTRSDLSQEAAAVRDCGVLTADWRSYLAYLKDLDRFIRDERPWTVTIYKPFSDQKNRSGERIDNVGSWSYLGVKELGPDPRELTTPAPRARYVGNADGGRPARPQVRVGSGRQIGYGIEIRLESELANKPVALIREGEIDLTQNWSLLRLALDKNLANGPADVELPTRSLDGTPDRSIVLRFDQKSIRDRLPPVGMPKAVPALP
jgi:hypothetical protein